MRNLLFVLFSTLILASCSNYQKLLKSDDLGAKYAAADSLYTIGKYKKSLKLMEQIVPAFRGRPQAEKLMFMYANTFYILGDNYLSGYQFERFVDTYPQSDSVEVAAFKSAKSYYELSPRFSLDQEDTYTAIEKLQGFVNKFPNSKYREEANELSNELTTKLEKKDIEVANQNLKIADYLNDYRPAITSFENFITDHPGSAYRKDAYFGRFKAQYLLAINSLPSLVQERLQKADSYYKSFMKYYAESELRTEADQIKADIDARLAETPTI